MDMGPEAQRDVLLETGNVRSDQTSELRDQSSLTVDEFLTLGRRSQTTWVPAWPTIRCFLLVGPASYALPSMITLSPAYLNHLIEKEPGWFESPESATRLLDLASMAFFACWGPGAFCLASLADRIGRKPVMLLSVGLTVALGVVCAIAPNFAVFGVARALQGASLGGGGAVGYVLCAEWATPRDTAVMTAGLNVLFALAVVLLATSTGLGHAQGWSWQTSQLLLCAFLGTPCLLSAPFILESPRFLVTAGRGERAEAYLRATLARTSASIPPAAALSKGTGAGMGAGSSASAGAGAGAAPQASTAATAVDEGIIEGGSGSGGGDGGCSGAAGDGAARPPGDVAGGRNDCAACGRCGLLLSMPVLPRILIVGACWLSVSLLYYGLSFAIGHCDEKDGCNPYQNGALLALVDVPGNVLACHLADLPHFGRRSTMAMAFLLGGLCLLLSPLASGYTPAAWHLTLGLGLVGKTCAAAAFLLAYLFPTELFPTAIRASALGVCNIFSRLGSIAAPLAADLPPVVTNLVLGSLAVGAGLLALLLPETRGTPMGSTGTLTQ